MSSLHLDNRSVNRNSVRLPYRFPRASCGQLSQLASIGTVALLMSASSPVLAQDLPLRARGVQTAQANVVVQTPATAGWLFVNPNTGDDASGNGSENGPFRTITHALKVAPPNTIISLAAGTYNAQTGESFPIKLQPEVTLHGDPTTKGKTVVITGGGIFVSPTFASQNIAILGADRSQVRGVTVTNPNPRGYGLWIESTSPLVAENTFTGNTHDGISITGNGSPAVHNNYFADNGANGMTIYGSSRAEVRGNVFENTGFGVNVAQKAAPLLIDNRILNNKDGIVLQASSRPVLRNNEIANNQRDGLVAIADSQPDLGTETEPGGNTFRNNGRFDLNASATSQAIPAFGNQLSSPRTKGEIDFSGRVRLASAAVAPTVKTTVPVALSLLNSPAPKSASAVPRAKPQSSHAVASQIQADGDAVAIPVPPPVGNALSPTTAKQTASVKTAPTRPIATDPPVAIAQSRNRRRSTKITNTPPNSTATSRSAVSPAKINAASFPVPASLSPQVPAAPAQPRPVLNSGSAAAASSSAPVKSVNQVRQVPVTAVRSQPTAVPAASRSTAAPIRLQGRTPLPPPPQAARSARPLPAATAASRPSPLAQTLTQRRPLSRTAIPTSLAANNSTNNSANHGIAIPVPPPESNALAKPPHRGIAPTRPFTLPPPRQRPAVPSLTAVPPTPAVRSRQTYQSATPDLLPVPGTQIPIGDSGSVTQSLTLNPLSGQPPSSRSFATTSGSYRVIVEARTAQQEAQVRALVPRAFRTVANGRAVMQAGVFGRRDNAERMRQLLQRQGLRATVEAQ